MNKFIYSECVEDTYYSNIHKIYSKYQKLIYSNLNKCIWKITYQNINYNPKL